MDLDYVIVSTNSEPLYYDFWEVIKSVWYKVIEVKPILVFISDENSIEYFDDHIIVKIKSIPNIDTGFQAQVSRMWVTQFFKDKICLTSDIDMLPINKKYFKDSIKDITGDKLVIYSSDAYKNQKRYPICYNAAKGQVFEEVLKLNTFKDFEDYCVYLLSRNEGWDTDELYFGECVDSFHKDNLIVKLNRGWNMGFANNRIDRGRWGYNKDEILSYVDSHMLRPYKRYKTEIDELISLI